VSRYFLRRILMAVPTLIVISIVVFGILALAPGDPLSQFAANPDVPPEVRIQIRHEFGLDQPPAGALLEVGAGLRARELGLLLRQPRPA